MKIDLTNETPKVKQAILEELIPAYQEKVISEMTSLSASTIGYYRRTYKIPTFHAKKKALTMKIQLISLQMMAACKHGLTT
mgnify:CR=1 FL=1